MGSERDIHWAAWLGGIALGAAAMYIADPAQGKRRRALAQDQMRRVSRKAGDALSVAVRDAGNQLHGLQAQATSMLRRQQTKPIDDHVLEARVSSKIGRKVSNWHAIDVEADEGCVTLSGPVLAEEKAQLLELVQAIPGVTEVRDELDVYDDPANIPDLQGAYASSKKRRQSMRDEWSPAARMMAVLGGGMLGYYGLTRRGAGSNLLMAAGLGLLARAFGSMEDLKNLVGLSGNRMVEVTKTIDINATPETVFDVWSKYDNFPHFMSHVVEVRDLGQQRSHWVVKGPLGTTYEFDSVLTECERPTRMAWKSEPDAEIENQGSIRLEPMNGGTRATVQMSYCPPGGMLGESIASIMGHDPEQELADDLVRMKEFIERGVPAHDAVQPMSTAGQILH